MISSTKSRESALRSSTKEVAGLTSSSSTPSCSAMILRTLSKTVATNFPPVCGLPSRHEADRAQDTVNELGGALPAEGFGQLHRLVDGGPHWHPIIEQDFEDGKPEYVAVHHRHLLERPGRRFLADHLVDLLPMFEDARYQLPPRGLYFWGRGSLLQLARQDVLRLV